MFKEKVFDTKYGPLAYLESSGGHTDKIILHFHGGFGKPSFVKSLGSNFSSKGYKAIAPYLPGHGPSFKLPKDFTYGALLETISSFFDSFPIDRVILSGHSFGGRLAHDLSNRHTKKIYKLVLSAPLLGQIPRGPVSTFLHILQDRFIDGLHAMPLKKTGLDNVPIHRPHYKSFSTFWNLVSSIPPTSTFGAHVPTLVLWGNKDSVLPYNTQHLFVDQLQQLRKRQFTGGHYWYLRNPRAIIEAIEEFIRT